MSFNQLKLHYVSASATWTQGLVASVSEVDVLEHVRSRCLLCKCEKLKLESCFVAGLQLQMLLSELGQTSLSAAIHLIKCQISVSVSAFCI